MGRGCRSDAFLAVESKNSWIAFLTLLMEGESGRTQPWTSENTRVRSFELNRKMLPMIVVSVNYQFDTEKLPKHNTTKFEAYQH